MRNYSAYIGAGKVKKKWGGGKEWKPCSKIYSLKKWFDSAPLFLTLRFNYIVLVGGRD